MKYFTKSSYNVTLFIFCLFFNTGRSSTPSVYCGAYELYYTGMYFQIISQNDFLSDKKLSFFLHCPDDHYCSEEAGNYIDTSVSDWITFLGKSWNEEEAGQLIFQTPLETYLEFQNNPEAHPLLKKVPEKKRKALIEYMILAKRAEGVSSNRSRYWNTWYEGEEPQGMKDYKPELLEEAIAKMKQEKDPLLKQRYVFQIVRLAHYLQENELALSYFDQFAKKLPGNEYIYYRALEQRSGAAINLGRHQEAAQGFLDAFVNLPLRAHSNAISLQTINWRLLEESGVVFPEIYRESTLFFKAYFLRGTGMTKRSMEQLMQLNMNSPYLEVLALRMMDKAQMVLFPLTEDRTYGFETEGMMDEDILTLRSMVSELAVHPEVKRKDFWKIIRAMIHLKEEEYAKGKKLLETIKTGSPFYASARYLSFASEVLAVQTIDRKQINNLYLRLKEEPLLAKSETAPFFFNYVSGLYYKNGNFLAGHLGYVPKVEASQWESVINSMGSWYLHYDKHELLSDIYLESFEQFLNQKDKTEYEQLLLSRMGSDPEDYLNDLKGTYYFSKNQLAEAIECFKKVKKSRDFYEPYYRSEMFSGAIREYFDTDFASQSDLIHEKYEKLFEERLKNKGRLSYDQYEEYRDNKLKLAQVLQKIEQLAEKNSVNAADYYYMLGNAWYNMSTEGWFLNTLHYAGNNARNSFNKQSGYYWYANEAATQDKSFMQEQANVYFQKALEAKGNKETKAKALFMLAKNNYCYTTDRQDYSVSVCDIHREYFEEITAKYSDTRFQKDIIRECSWYRAFLNL